MRKILILLVLLSFVFSACASTQVKDDSAYQRSLQRNKEAHSELNKN